MTSVFYSKSILKTFRRTYWALFKRVNPLAYWKGQLRAVEVIDDLQQIDEISEIVARLEMKYLSPRADAVNLGYEVLPPLGNGNSHWNSGRYDEGSWLKLESIRKLKILVEDREHIQKQRRREGLDSVIKWVTAIASVIAALASTWRVFFRTLPTHESR